MAFYVKRKGAMLLVICLALLLSANCSEKGKNCKKKTSYTSTNMTKITEKESSETATLRKNWMALKQRGLRLIPVPKLLSFSGQPVVVTGEKAMRIVIVLTNASKRGTIAANEIISRVQELAPDTKSLVSLATKKQTGAYNVVIENHWPNSFTNDTSVPTKARKTEQGYSLTPTAGGITLAGQGELGMLYAAVTLRWLIERKGDHVVLYPARIVDWPDFGRRQIAGFLAPYHMQYREKPQKHLTHMKQFADWAFRLKATDITGHTYVPYHKKLTAFNTKPYASDNVVQATRLVSDYLSDRGIVTMFAHFYAGLAYHPQDDSHPEVKQMMYNRVHKRYYSWAMHDLHRFRAQRYADYCKRAGVRRAFIHCVDSGGIQDPELWSLRDPLTRKKYGNNRVQADADQFNIYINIFRKAGIHPGVFLYPYSGHYLQETFALEKLGLPDTPASHRTARKMVNRVSDFMLAINKKLDTDVRMCTREAPHQVMMDFYQCYPGRPMEIYFEVHNFNRDIGALLPPEIRCFYSAYDPKRPKDDVIWLKMPRVFGEPASVCGAEYTWNTSFPMRQDLGNVRTPNHKSYDYDPKALNIMAERAAVGLWGARVGKDLKELLCHHLSFHLAVEPKTITARHNLKPDEYLALLQHNRDATVKAETAMDRVWARVKAEGGTRLMDSFSYPIFIQYYWMVKGARPYTEVYLTTARAYDFAQKGDMDAASKAIEKGRQAMTDARKEYQRVVKMLANEPMLIQWKDLSRWWRGYPNLCTRTLNPDFKKMEKILDDTEKAKETIFREYNVPDWLKGMLKRKPLTIVCTDAAISIDGMVDEPAWTSSVPVEHFVGYKTLKTPDTPVVVRFLRDKNTLYISGEIVQPLAARIEEPKRSLKDYAYTESIELFFVPDKKTPDKLYQLIIDSAGNIFSLKKEPMQAGPARSQPGWKYGGKSAAKKTDRGWSFELSVPLASLHAVINDNWLGLVAYNRLKMLKPRQIDSYACLPVEGKSFHAVDRYPPIIFSNHPRIESPRATLQILSPNKQEKIHESGTGSLVTFGVRLETHRPLYDVQINARFLGKGGKLIEQVPLETRPYLCVCWQTMKPFAKQLLVEHKGITLEVIANYRTLTGEKGRVVEQVVLGDMAALIESKDQYTTGIRNGSQALAVPFFFNTQTDAGTFLSFEHGTLSFWIRPDWDASETINTVGNDPYRTLVHCGPMHPKRPLDRNLDAFSILKHKTARLIYFQIANHKFQQRNVSAHLPSKWKAGEWHHLAFVWDLNTGGKTRMEIYIDGHKQETQVHGSHNSGNKALTTRPHAYPVQFGCMNSSLRPANASFDLVQLWNYARYNTDFVPPKTVRDADDELLQFDFESTMNGIYRKAGKEITITAHIGSQFNPYQINCKK